MVNALKEQGLDVRIKPFREERENMGWTTFRKIIVGCDRDGPAYNVCHPFFWDCSFKSRGMVVNRVLVNASCKTVAEQCLKKLLSDSVASFPDTVLSIVDDMERIYEGVRDKKYGKTFLTFPDDSVHRYKGSTCYEGVPEKLAEAILDCLKWEITWEKAAREGGHEWNKKHINPDRWPHQFG